MNSQNEEPKERRPYDIGYKKPPKKHQFQKGQSGNPQGRKRKKRERDMRLVLERVLAEEVVDERSGKRMSNLEAVMLALRDAALRGKPVAARKLTQLAQKTGYLIKKEAQPFVRIEDRNIDDEILQNFKKSVTEKAEQ